MFTNRIARYYSQDADSALERDQPNQVSEEKPPKVPSGFIALPGSMIGPQPTDLLSLQQQLYKAAYEAAKKAAREKLLELLRSRWN
jgi:hypothetical protein